MALGPKAMGEAIAANLKVKTGKPLEDWLASLDAEQPSDAKAAATWLRQQGLGHFQAQLVVQKWNGEPLYDDPAQIVADLFEGFDEQERLYNRVVDDVSARYEVVVNPCKGYVPLYSKRNRIFASFKPTAEGLYIGLIGSSFDFPTVPHARSLGGSERMVRGRFVADAEAGVEAVCQSYENEENGD
ncbi:DUF4287 domain-containing protein [Phytoactinopolyspora mesophila]|nr:DUF4287 domain-containing protein [Phytoactinopolyspora mesophila]